MRTFLAVLLLATAFAGCLGNTDDSNGSGDGGSPITAPDNWAERAIFGDGVNPDEYDFVSHGDHHDHNDRDHHVGLSTPNFEILGWDPLTTNFHGGTAGGYFCGEVSKEGDRKLAVVNSFTSGVAIVIVDVTDPMNPQMVGEFELANTHIYDSAITDDGRFAVLATSPTAALDHGDGSANPVPGAALGTYTTRAIWTTDCGTYMGPEQELPFYSGTMLIDLADPAAPALADFVPAPALGPHSISSTRVDDTNYIASSITNLQNEASYFHFFTTQENPVTGGKLVPYGTFTAQYARGYAETASNDPGQDSGINTIFAMINGHVDATVYKHPVTGQLLAGLANWEGGLITLDISLPGAFVPLSTWGDVADTSIPFGGSIHSAYPIMDLRNERFLFVTGQEVGGSFDDGEGTRRPTGQITILDMTDPAAPEPVARWTLPTWVAWDGNGGTHSLLFSTHYSTVVGDVLYTAMYHGGVWAADMSEQSWPELPSLGVFIPDNQPEEPALTQFVGYSPTVLDVLALEDGSLLTFDAESGAYTLKFHEETDVPIAAPWIEDAWIGA